MRALLLLIAATLALGSYFSEAKPATDTDADTELAGPACGSRACRLHGPYLHPRRPGGDWPAFTPRGRDPHCQMRIIPVG